MNLLFDYAGWTGNAWTQATTDIWREIPVLTSMGSYLRNGALTTELDLEGQALLAQYRSLEYYYGTHFQYGS